MGILSRLLLLASLYFALVALSTANDSVETRLRALEEARQKDKEEIAALKAHIGTSSSTGELKLFVDGRTACPDGYDEVNVTQGMMLVGRPWNGRSGSTFNRPLDASELGRAPPHSHAVSVKDPGHTHVSKVYDPGHTHTANVNDPGHTHSTNVNDPGHNHSIDDPGHGHSIDVQ